MADIDQKISQRVFKYQWGLYIPDTAEPHGLPTRAVNQVIKFKSTVYGRIDDQEAQQAAG